MRASVLHDPRLAKHAGRFVWVSIDAEKPENAAFLERHPVGAFPTFLVIPPGDAPPVRWVGGATAQQLERLLNGASAQSPTEEAVLGHEAARRYEACATVAARDARRLERSLPFATVVATGLSCTLAAPHDAPWRRRALRSLEPLAREALGVRGLSADDRAGLYDVLADARWDQGDVKGARAIARRHWAFLEEDRRRGRTAEERAALDGYRVVAAEALGDPARALPPLAESERELPGDYNPPARTARLLLDLGRLADARAAADRALALAYGPRKLKVYQLAATIEARRADLDAEKRILDEALGYADSLPPAQRDARTTAETTQMLRARRVVLGLRG